MLSGVLLWVAICTCGFLWWRARVRESRAHPLPPAMPGGLPIIGHLHKLIFNNLLDTINAIDKHTMEAGGVMHIQAGPDIYYTISDLEDALTVANTCLEKHFLYNFMQSWLGEGLLTAPAVVWRRHRKLLHPVFGLPMIHGFLEVFNRQSREFLNSLDPYAGNGKTDLTADIKKIIFQTSRLAAFGEIDIEDNTQSEQYFKALNQYIKIIVNRFQKVWLHNDTLYKLLGSKKKEGDMVKTLKEITDEVLIKNSSSSTHGTNTDANYNGTAAEIGIHSFLNEIQRKTEKELTEQEIREELDTTIVASFDTSYVFFTNLLVLIGSYPEVQEKMYEEIMDVVGPDRDLEKEDLSELVYTDAVIKESLRFLPPVSAIARYIDKDVKLKNYTLRAGNQCLILLKAMLHHPSWGDANKFRPERWLDAATLPKNASISTAFSIGKRSCIEKYTLRAGNQCLILLKAMLHHPSWGDANKFRPERWLDAATLPKNASISTAFSIGKRSCIGRTYAMLSAKVSVAHVVRKYRLTADHTKMQFTFEGLMKPVAGHEIDLQRRN